MTSVLCCAQQDSSCFHAVRAHDAGLPCSQKLRQTPATSDDNSSKCRSTSTAAASRACSPISIQHSTALTSTAASPQQLPDKLMTSRFGQPPADLLTASPSLLIVKHTANSSYSFKGSFSTSSNLRSCRRKLLLGAARRLRRAFGCCTRRNSVPGERLSASLGFLGLGMVDLQ